MSEFKIDFFELCFLSEVCIPPVPIARHMFFDNLTNIYYHQMTNNERDRLYEWIKPKLDLTNDSCKIFEARFNPDNQYMIKSKFNDKIGKHTCFKMNDRYYIDKNTWIDSEYITEVNKI